MNTFSDIHLNSLPGPQDIHRKVLSNGITILTRENFQSPSVVISGLLGAGSLFDTADRLGLAYFTSMALMRGTESMDFQTIYDRLESAGASLGFAASVHNTNFGGKALAEDLPLLVSTLAECLLHPTFPEMYMERLKAQIISGLTVRAQDTIEMSALTFDHLLFNEHPYGRPEDGTIETIHNINRQHLVEFHRNHYGPDSLVIVIVGAVSAQAVFDLVEEKLGKLAKSSTGSLAGFARHSSSFRHDPAACHHSRQEPDKPGHGHAWTAPQCPRVSGCHTGK